MKKMKISFAALAFVLAIGGSLVSKADFTPGWYAPSYPESTQQLDNPPANCTGNDDLCATDYDADQNVIGIVKLDD